MSWLIYTLLGVLIIVLLVYIIWSVMPKETIKEGMLDYFTVEQYLQTLPTTQGRYVRIRPSPTSGDGRLTISQVQVLDMNGTNIALKRPVFGTSTYMGSAPVTVTVDGNLSSRTGFANYWTSSNTNISTEFWVVDLGAVHQINQVIFIGATEKSTDTGVLPTSTLRISGMICEILDTSLNVTATQTFLQSSITQALTFPNSLNITPTPSGAAIGLLNPLMIPLNSAQPEVYSVSGSYTQSQADMTCGILGGVVATSGQLNDAYSNGASWCSPGWTYSQQLILSNPGCPSGINTPAFTSTSQAAVNCFGIKPASGVNSTINPFNTNAWSQYAGNSTATYYGATTITVPDVQKLYAFVKNTLIPNTAKSLSTSISSQTANLPAAPCTSDGQCGMKITTQLSTAITYGVADLDAALSTTANPNGCLTASPACSAAKLPDSLIVKYGSYSNVSLYSALAAAPLNLIKDDGTSTASQISGLNSTLQMFGNVSATAISDMNTSINLCSLIFLGSNDNVDKYINVRLTDFKPYMRANPGFTNFCKPEILQSVVNGDFAFNVSKENQASNISVCNTLLTTDMLGLLPSPAANYLISWIYNRTKRLIMFKQSSNTLTQADLNNLGLSSLTPTSASEIILNSVIKMVPTVGGAVIPIDVTNNYILDKIGQSFYEAMGGNYTMSQIYDVYTIGSTILDIRFDMTKHTDVSIIQAQIADLKSKYYSIRVSNVSQDILDTAKAEYEASLAELQGNQTTNILPPVVGVVGRFFYTYSTATQVFQITGFSLDSRSVSCFIPELNGGIQVNTGGAAGTLNYTPNILYTKNIPEALPCTDLTTIRRIIDDYVDLTQAELQSVLLGTLNADGNTYTGPAGVPSMDTNLGTVHVNQVIGAIQISPTQCALKWTETLWNDASNVPVSAALTNVTRRALFSYTVDAVDWYANSTTIDPSGTVFYPTDTVPACSFDPVAWQQKASPRLDALNPVTNLADIKTDFMTNGWNNGIGLVCPKQISNYIFSAQDYCAANADLNTKYNGGGAGPMNSAAAKSDYMTTGITSNRVIRAAQPITPLSMPVTIQQSLPANYVLDTLSDICPPASCEDLNVLYTLVDQYNNDPSMPGSILRVTRAYTASPYQCDVEVDINYGSTVLNGAGNTVKKGSFNYDNNGNEIPCINCPPSISQQVVSGVTLALSTKTNVADCSISLLDAGKQNSGTTIQSNTPPLYKPMDYSMYLQNINSPMIAKSFNNIATTTANTAFTANSMLTSYQNNTIAAVGSIGTLGEGCNVKCSDTAILNDMIAFYKSQANHTTQINTVLRVGSLSNNSCDMSYQRDNLSFVPGIGGGKYKVSSSQTASTRFTLSPGTSPCTFTTTAMTPILPVKCSDPAILNNMMAFYKSNINNISQINTVMKVGSMDGNSCDMTFQEDNLTWTPGPGGGTYTPNSSQTAGMHFTLSPGATPDTFITTDMTRTIPTIPANMMDLPLSQSAIQCNEAYGINSATLNQSAAIAKCASYGAVLATKAQLTDASGGSWTNPGYVVDVSGFMFYPTGAGITSVNATTTSLGGAVCYGIKPDSGKYPDVLPYSGSQWNQSSCMANINYVNPSKEGFANYGKPLQVSESTFPLNKRAFGLDMARNQGGPPLDTLYEEPLRAEMSRIDQGPSPIDDGVLRPEKAKSYKYIRFRPIKTRDPMNSTVDVGKFRFFLGPVEVDLRFAKAMNPMGSWVGDIQDVVGEGYRRGWSDLNKKAIVFAFPYAILMNGFTWTTANPDRGVGGDPVQWKLEGSQNGTYWTVLRDQTRHNYPVPMQRYQELPIFRF